MKKNLFFLLFLAIGLSSCNKVNIESPEEVKEFIKGKWHNEFVDSGGLVTYYRFEITETEIKCWKSNMILSNNGRASDNIISDWTEQTPVALSIGSIQTEPESDRSYEKKYRILGNCSYGTYTFESNVKLGTSFTFKENYRDDYQTCDLHKGWEF